jgi:ribose transport system permease protein
VKAIESQRASPLRSVEQAIGAVARVAAKSTAVGTGVGLLVICVVLSFASPYFLTTANILNILLDSATLAIIAGGLTITLICAEIDLSVGSVEALAGSVMAVLIASRGLPWGLALVIGLAVGGLAGYVSGFFATRYGLPSFVTSLAMLGIAQGMAFVVTGGVAVLGLPAGLEWIGQGKIGPLPTPVVIAAGVLVLLHLVLTRTILGVNIYAVGGNAEAAKLVGINVARVKLTVMILSAVLAAFAGIILAARLGAGAPNVGATDLIDAVAAAVIGGTSLMGGSGNIPGTVVGVLLISTIRNGLVLLGVQSYWQLVAIGTLILAAVFLDHMLKRAAYASSS